MDNCVWKYKIPLQQEVFYLAMPPNAEILHLGVQGTTPCIWARVNPDEKREDVRTFVFMATGQEDNAIFFQEYIGTIMIPADGDSTSFVFHLFEIHAQSDKLTD